MDSHSLYASRRAEAGARLRPCVSDLDACGQTASRLASSAFVKDASDTRGSSRVGKCASEAEQYPPGVGRPTSPAFMRLLSQRSPKSPSQSSRSPSLISRLSSRRRVSSPTIAARAWLRPAGGSPLPSSASGHIPTGSGTPGHVQNLDEHGDYGPLIHSRSRPDRKISRDESKEPRGRSSSRQNRKGRKKRRESPSSPSRDGCVLQPMEVQRRRPSRGRSTPSPRLVISPRHLPPPTFEKILLGRADSDFASGNDDTDVFGGEISLERQEPERQEEDECTSLSVGPEELTEDQHSSLSAFTSRASPESSFGDRVDSHRDGIIPEHYLYIPPLRLGTSTEEGRPVPALQQAGDDNDQVSVRGERRHIATLFSLEAAESRAQKARLQEQLKATSPFRLAEMGDSSSAAHEGLEGPPGKSKRRQRSTVLEMIVRQHDWEANEPSTEGETQAYEGPPTPREATHRAFQAQDNASETAASNEDVHWDDAAEYGILPDVSHVVSAQEGRDLDSAHSRGEQGHAELDAGEAEFRRPAYRSQDGPVGDEPGDVPGAFDAIWGGYEEPRENKDDMASEAANWVEANRQDEIFGADNGPQRLSRMAEFLGVPPVLADGGEEERLISSANAAGDRAAGTRPGDAAKDPVEVSSSSRGLVGDGGHGGIALLSLGDPGEWEVRYSTAEGFASSAEPSPLHSVQAISPHAGAEKHAGGTEGEQVGDEEGEQANVDFQDVPRQESSGQLPEEPPGAGTYHREVSYGHSRMNSYNSSRVVPLGHCDPMCHPSGPPADGRSDAAVRVTNEPRLGAALDFRMVSLQSFQGEGVESQRAPPRRPVALAPNRRRFASRKRQRTRQEDGSPETCGVWQPPTDRRVHADWSGGATKTVRDSTASTLAGDAEYFSSMGFRKENSQQKEPHPNRAATPKAHAAAGPQPEKAMSPPEAAIGRVAPENRLQLGDAMFEADAWEEGGVLPLHEVEGDAADGQQTDRRGSGSLCEIDLSEPFRASDGLESRCSPPPAPSRSTEIFRAINRATGGCAYGPGVHVVIVGSMMLAVWALLAVFYAFDEGHRVRFFVGCAVALSFLLALCLGSIQLTASLFKWRALKHAIDFDMRELLFFSLKRLRPAPDARDPSIEGMGERGRQLRLACDCYIELITQGSPRLELNRVVERRFLLANSSAGAVGAALVALLECSVQTEGNGAFLQFQAGDAAAIGAAALYSILLLALSYWLATPPPPAAVQRAVEKHAAFQYLWALTFADVLVDRGAVTAKSAEDLRLQYKEELPRQSSPYLLPLKNSLLRRNKNMSTICIRGIPSSIRSNFMTARIVWQFPDGVSSKILKDFRLGQRVLMTLTAAPLHTQSSNDTRASLYLNLFWCGSRGVPEELQIPIGFDSLDCESVTAGRIPSRLRSLLRAQGGPDVGSAVTPQGPLEVMRFILGLLQGDSTESFQSSQTRRYLSEPAPLPSTSCECPLILRIPIKAIGCGSRSAAGSRLRHIRNTMAQDSSRGVPGVRVGPWTIQSPCSDVATPGHSLQLHTCTNQRVDVPANAPSAPAAVPLVYNNGRASQEFAFVTLLFASEEQREEFNGCLEEILCA